MPDKATLNWLETGAQTQISCKLPLFDQVAKNVQLIYELTHEVLWIRFASLNEFARYPFLLLKIAQLSVLSL